LNIQLFQLTLVTIWKPRKAIQSLLELRRCLGES
jgi:hypothetical protein